jgi:hypothetical protein
MAAQHTEGGLLFSVWFQEQDGPKESFKIHFLPIDRRGLLVDSTGIKHYWTGTVGCFAHSWGAPATLVSKIIAETTAASNADGIIPVLVPAGHLEQASEADIIIWSWC